MKLRYKIYVVFRVCCSLMVFSGTAAEAAQEKTLNSLAQGLIPIPSALADLADCDKIQSRE